MTAVYTSHEGLIYLMCFEQFIELAAIPNEALLGNRCSKYALSFMVNHLIYGVIPLGVVRKARIAELRVD